MVLSRSNDLLQRIRHDFVPLATCYEVAASASAGEAYELKPCLVDAEHQSSAFIFITSGAIDRYVHSHGIKPIRYLKTTYQKPWLPFGCPTLSANRQRQYSAEKVLVAGMTKRLEAIWDNGVVAGSVPSVQIISTSNSLYPLRFVLGVVNSTFIDWLFRQYYSSLSLAGGYLRIGVPQISQLPLVPAEQSADQRRTIDRVVGLVDRMIHLKERGREVDTPTDRVVIQREIVLTDSQIDREVSRWFGLTEAEVVEVTGVL